MVEQLLPINIYRSDRRLMVATRAPGLEPENIRIELQGLRLSVAGALRGLGQAKKPGYVPREWSVGPYQRTVDLPSPVDSTRANASYDNGVLVLIFPHSSQPVSGTIPLVKVGTAKGSVSAMSGGTCGQNEGNCRRCADAPKEPVFSKHMAPRSRLLSSIRRQATGSDQERRTQT